MNEGTDLLVAAADAGKRLDVFLRERVEGLGRAGAKRLVEEGLVRVNGRRAPKATVLAEGDRVAVEGLDAPTVAVVADPDLPLTLRYEDADVVVVDKPAGVPSQPLRPGERGTVASALVARFPETVGLGRDPRDAGLLHRLDVDTSGLLVAARSAEAFDRLRAALEAGEIEKRYQALVGGLPEAPRTVDVALAPEPGNRARMRACYSLEDVVRYDAKPARTDILSAEPRGDFALVTVSAARAVRHQVRAHLATEGFPLVGDALYGGPERPGGGGHLLHAGWLAFPHPRTGARIEVSSPLPADWPA